MLAQEGQDVALESDGEGRWGGAVHGLRGGGGGDAAQGCAIPGDDAQRGEQDAPPVVSRAVAQDHLEGVVGSGGEADAVIGPVGEIADAQQKLGPRASRTRSFTAWS